jgi:hypothetical protein
MARPPSKKVTRAAQTGGGRTNRGGQAWAYWALLTVISVLGVVGVLYSRQEHRDEVAGSKSLVPPKAGVDHWHAAYGIYICDKFVAPITNQRDPEGIHTHGDGVIHIHPTLRRSAGKNATLGKFVQAAEWKLTDSEMRLPDGTRAREGKDKCNGKNAELQIKLKGQDKVRTTNLAGLTFSDRMVFTLAFVPKGTEIPLPASESQLDNLSDVSGATTTVPPPPTPTSTGDTTPSSTAPPTTGAPTTTSK